MSEDGDDLALQVAIQRSFPTNNDMIADNDSDIDLAVSLSLSLNSTESAEHNAGDDGTIVEASYEAIAPIEKEDQISNWFIILDIFPLRSILLLCENILHCVQMLAKNNDDYNDDTLKQALARVEDVVVQAEKAIRRLTKSSEDLLQKLLIDKHTREVIEAVVTEDTESSIMSYDGANADVNSLVEAVGTLSSRKEEVALQQKKAREVQERVEVNAKVVPILTGAVGAG